MFQQQQLRKRNVATGENMNTERNDFIPRSATGLSAQSMMKSSPTLYGAVLKLHIPLFYTVCPNFLKRIFSSVRCFSFLTPKWTERYLILIGSFLYKFKDSNAPAPKGSPFPVESVDVHLVSQTNLIHNDSLEGMEIRSLPPGYEAVLCVSSLRKRHYYAVTSREDCLAWANSLGEARQEAIKRSMGHTAHVPYPKSYEYFDTLGKDLLKSRERIKSKIEESHVKEMEMSSIGEGGPLPRGYYG